MRTVRCGVCRDKILLDGSEYRICHSELDKFCSVECLLKRIEAGGPCEPIHTVPKPSGNSFCCGFRSDFEGVVAKFLEKEKIGWMYEPFAIRLVDGRRYIPDFFLPRHNLLIEAKGRWSVGGKEKMECVLSTVPINSLIMIPTYLSDNMERIVYG